MNYYVNLCFAFKRAFVVYLNMIQVECRFRNMLVGKPGYRKWTKEFTVYEPEDEKPKHYIPKEKVHECIKELKLGDLIETYDGYVVPVIKEHPISIRVAAMHSINYKRSLVRQEKINITFQKDEFYRDCSGKGRLTTKSREFCYRFALTNNLQRAAQETYHNSSKRSAYHHGYKLLKQEKIKMEVQRILRELIKISGKKEETFFLNRMEKHQDKLENIVDKLVKKLDNGGIEQEDGKILVEALDQQQKAMLINAKLLGYDDVTDRGAELPKIFDYPEITDAVEIGETKKSSGSRAIAAPKKTEKVKK